MVYVLWSIPSASALATYETEADALAAVHEGVERNGLPYGLDLLLTRENRRGDTRTVASGAELVQRAREMSTDERPRSVTTRRPGSRQLPA